LEFFVGFHFFRNPVFWDKKKNYLHFIKLADKISKKKIPENTF